MIRFSPKSWFFCVGATNKLTANLSAGNWRSLSSSCRNSYNCTAKNDVDRPLDCLRTQSLPNSQLFGCSERPCLSAWILDLLLSLFVIIFHVKQIQSFFFRGHKWITHDFFADRLSAEPAMQIALWKRSGKIKCILKVRISSPWLRKWCGNCQQKKEKLTGGMRTEMQQVHTGAACTLPN